VTGGSVKGFFTINDSGSSGGNFVITLLLLGIIEGLVLLLLQSDLDIDGIEVVKK